MREKGRGRIPQESRGAERRVAYGGVPRARPEALSVQASQGAPGWGPLFVCKIRPPGARRRRATDIHVTLLPYRYRSRRHNTARRTYPPSVGEKREEIGGGERKRDREREGEGGKRRNHPLYFSYEPVRYVSFSARQRCRVQLVDNCKKTS